MKDVNNSLLLILIFLSFSLYYLKFIGLNDSKTFKKYSTNEKMNNVCFSIIAKDKRSLMKGENDEYSG